MLEATYPGRIKVDYMQGYLEATWADLMPYDIIFVQRPSNTVELDFVSRCGSAHKKIWVDYDDLLTGIPQGSPVHHISKDNHWVIPSILKAADLVTVSTSAIKQAYKECNPNIHVVKNAHNDFLFPVEAKENPEIKGMKKPRIVWRGSPTHDGDLHAWKKELKRIQKKYSLHTFGWFSEFARRELGIRYENMRRGMETMDYFHEFYKINPHLSLFPLEHTEFNQSKSNICALETLYAGGICMVPEGFPEFTGTALQFNSVNIEELIKRVLSDPETFMRLHNAHWNKVLSDQILSKTNAQRIQLIEAL